MQTAGANPRPREVSGRKTAWIKCPRVDVRAREETDIGRAVVLVAFALTFLVGLLLLSSAPAAAGGTADLEGGEGQLQIFVWVGSAFDLAESGRPIPIEIEVTDVNGLPRAGVPVLLSASIGTVSPDVVVTDATGRASFTFLADVGESTTARILAQTNLDGAAQGVDAFFVRVVHLPPPPIYARAEILSIGVLSGLLVFASWTEPGRHAFFGLFFPLYTRLKREEILDHFLRGQVYGVIKTQPGTNFTTVRKLLGLSNGTLSYHLRTLESSGFVVSEREGIYKRFFAADLGAAAAQDGVRLSELQRRLLERLRQNAEVGQRDLAKDAGVTQQCISYNLRIMSQQGLVVKVRSGRGHRYIVVDG